MPDLCKSDFGCTTGGLVVQKGPAIKLPVIVNSQRIDNCGQDINDLNMAVDHSPLSLLGELDEEGHWQYLVGIFLGEVPTPVSRSEAGSMVGDHDDKSFVVKANCFQSMQELGNKPICESDLQQMGLVGSITSTWFCAPRIVSLQALDPLGLEAILCSRRQVNPWSVREHDMNEVQGRFTRTGRFQAVEEIRVPAWYWPT